MTTQYIRKSSLIIGSDTGDSLDLSTLRFRFSVRRGDNQTPNSADIRVYNVSDNTAARVQNEFTQVVLQCGYEGNFGVIFYGTVKQIRKGRESQTVTYLDITAADGDSAYNYSTSSYALAAANTSPKGVIANILKDLAQYSISQAELPTVAGTPLPRGKVIHGMTRDELRKVAANTQTAWSIQNGALTFIPLTSYLPGDVPVITSATGMIGIPEQTQNGIRVRILLNPNIKIGQAVKLDNNSINRLRYSLALGAQSQNLNTALLAKTNADGLYYVMRADHAGDTRGNDWYSDLTCLAIDATVSSSSAITFPAPQEVAIKIDG